MADAVDLQGIQGASHWEQAGLVRYRSRRDILEIALDRGSANDTITRWER